jgi:hypothetical protein
MKISIEKKIDSIKSEHLIGTKPIMYSIGSVEDFFNAEENDIQNGNNAKYGNVKNNFNLKNIKNINWFGKVEDFDRKKFKHNGESTYVMSEIDSSNKKSAGFYLCTGLIMSGTKKNGEVVSLLTHQSPIGMFADKNKEVFLKHLREKIGELKELCIPNTIDAVLIGGYNSENKFSNPKIESIKEKYYHDSIELISNEVDKVFNFKPVVINGPKKIQNKEDEIIYDNDNRRLYFIRPEVNHNIEKKIINGKLQNIYKDNNDFLTPE